MNKVNTKLISAFFLLFVAFAVSFSLAAAEHDSIVNCLPEIDEEMEVTLMTGWVGGSEAKAEKEFVEKVEKLYDGKLSITLERMQTDKIRQVASSRIAAGNPPAIAHLPPGYNISDWAQAGALLDLTDYWEDCGLVDLVPKGLRSACMIDDKYYAVPINMAQHNFMWWNKDVFEKYDSVPAPPYETWEDFFDAGEKFNKVADIPFFVVGLNPASLTLGNTTGLAAMRYGLDMYYRLLNGEASREDWRKLLTFNEKLLEYANEDAASTRGLFENQRRVAAGDGALTFQGVWGRSAFVEQDLKLNEDYGRGHFPGPKLFEYNPSSYVVFKGSGVEKGAIAIALANMIKSNQVLINKNKGTPTARSDVELDPDEFPEIVVSSAEYAKEAKVYPNDSNGLPAAVRPEYATVIQGYLTGTMGLEKALDDLMSIQEEFQEDFVLSF